MLDGEGGGGGNDEDDWDDGVDWKGQDVEVELPSAAEVGAKSRGVGAGGVIKEVVCNLTSIKDLRAQVIAKKHTGELNFIMPCFFSRVSEWPSLSTALTDLVQNHKFVGIVDYDLSLSAVQHSTKLYLINHAAIALVWIPLLFLLSRFRSEPLTVVDASFLFPQSEELFHQLGLLQFGAYARLTLEPAPDVRTLLETAIKFIPETELEEKDRPTKLEVSSSSFPFPSRSARRDESSLVLFLDSSIAVDLQSTPGTTRDARGVLQTQHHRGRKASIDPSSPEGILPQHG